MGVGALLDMKILMNNAMDLEVFLLLVNVKRILTL
jgi:hypothetical protein